MLRWFLSTGKHGWVIILTIVVLFDLAVVLFGGELLTTTTRRWFQQGGWSRVVEVIVIAFLVFHLTVGSRWDPLDRLFGWLRDRPRHR